MVSMCLLNFFITKYIRNTIPPNYGFIDKYIFNISNIEVFLLLLNIEEIEWFVHTKHAFLNNIVHISACGDKFLGSK